MRDVAYVLCNSIPIDVREASERALVARYCELLADVGIERDPGDAWQQYRLFAVYSWVAATATTTAGTGAKWHPVDVGLSGRARHRCPPGRRPPRIVARLSTVPDPVPEVCVSVRPKVDTDVTID